MEQEGEMTDAELRERIATAKAATPGPWRHGAGTHWGREVRANALGWREIVFAGALTEEEGSRNAAHIAANSPDATIALCEELLAHKQSIHDLLESSKTQFAELLALKERLRKYEPESV